MQPPKAANAAKACSHRRKPVGQCSQNVAAIAATEISHDIRAQIDIGVQMQYHAIQEI
jgi:hypothetical protein